MTVAAPAPNPTAPGNPVAAAESAPKEQRLSRAERAAALIKQQFAQAKTAVGEAVVKTVENTGKAIVQTGQAIQDTAVFVAPWTQAQLPPNPGLRNGPLPSGPGSARSARIVELPTLLQVAPALPLAEKTNTPAGRPLTLEQAMALGVGHSLDVRAAGERRTSFEETARASAGALLPKMDARAAVGSGRLESIEPHYTRTRKDGSITFSQPLYDLSATREMQRQRVLTQSSELQRQAATSAASIDVSAAYLQALQLRLNYELSSEYEKMLDELLAYINERASAGGTSNAERDRVRARVSNARAQMADSRANLRTALRNLESLIGEVPGNLDMTVPAALGVPADPEDALIEARQYNRDLVAARTEAVAAGLEAESYRSRLLPRVSVELSHNRAVNAAGTDSYTRDSKAMLVVSWNLLNGGTDLAQDRAAAARMREKHLRADEAERKLRQDLDAAYASLDAVGERYNAMRDELVANRAVVEAFRAQLVGGNRPLLDVLDAYQRLHQSKLDIAQLVVGEVQNHVRVAHLIGRLADADQLSR